MKKKGNEEGGSKWQDTYGDMVTLLLCFFVMLYAMSTVDQTKWRQVVISFNPKAAEKMEEYNGAGNEAGDIPIDIQGKKETGDDELYLSLVELIQELGLQNNVEVRQGTNYTYLNFRDRIFFDGDSSVLKPEGKAVLDSVAEVFAKSEEYIGEIYVMGHTSQATPERLNNPRTDRTLSALRAMEVTVYVQEKNLLAPEKLVNVSYGQFRPISPVDTTDGRSKNRRVEFVLTKDGTHLIPLEDIYTELYSDGGENPEDGVLAPLGGEPEPESEPEPIRVERPMSMPEMIRSMVKDSEFGGAAGEPAGTGAPSGAQGPEPLSDMIQSMMSPSESGEAPEETPGAGEYAGAGESAPAGESGEAGEPAPAGETGAPESEAL